MKIFILIIMLSVLNSPFNVHADSLRFDRMINTPFTMLDWGMYKMNNNLNAINWNKKIIDKINENNNLKQRMINLYSSYLTNEKSIGTEISVKFDVNEKLIIVSYGDVYSLKNSDNNIDIDDNEIREFINLIFKLLKKEVTQNLIKGVFDKQYTEHQYTEFSVVRHVKLHVVIVFFGTASRKCESLLLNDNILCEN